jgi:serine-type D-Ala-D-Ala carboxypeptidase (penicillin-binding protein 5/6)
MRLSSQALRVILLTCFVVASLCPSTVEAKKRSAPKKAGYRGVSADSALLFSENGWQKYYARDIHEKVLPASTTKVMAAIIVLERKRLDDIVTVSESATRVLPSKIDIKPGEKYRVRDLLYAALLSSSNDATVALAEAVAGSEAKFVQLMNDRARRLGAKNTLFANAHGLPSDRPQYTTAHDMFLMFREALKKQFFREAIKIKYITIHSEGDRKIHLKSHNNALFKGWKKNVYGKTGYTTAAKACFVGYVEKGKEILIIAVFGCSRRWDDVKYILEHYGGVDL